jgi:hypothetical protein
MSRTCDGSSKVDRDVFATASQAVIDTGSGDGMTERWSQGAPAVAALW